MEGGHVGPRRGAEINDGETVRSGVKTPRELVAELSAMAMSEATQEDGFLQRRADPAKVLEHAPPAARIGNVVGHEIPSGHRDRMRQR